MRWPRLVVHPPITNVDADAVAEGRSSSPLPNCTASSRAAAEGSPPPSPTAAAPDGGGAVRSSAPEAMRPVAAAALVRGFAAGFCASDRGALPPSPHSSSRAATAATATATTTVAATRGSVGTDAASEDDTSSPPAPPSLAQRMMRGCTSGADTDSIRKLPEAEAVTVAAARDSPNVNAGSGDGAGAEAENTAAAARVTLAQRVFRGPLSGCVTAKGTSSADGLAEMGGNASMSVAAVAPAPKEVASNGNPDDKGARSGGESTNVIQTTTTLAQRIDRYLFPPPKINFQALSPALLAASVGRREPRRWRHPNEATADEAVPRGTYASDAMSLLFGTDSVEGHYRRIRDVLSAARGTYGADGLRAVGFEFRLVPCERHQDRLSGRMQRPASFEEGDGRGSRGSLDSDLPMEEEEGSIEAPAHQRSHSDPLSSSFRRDFEEHNNEHLMEIMPSHPANVGDVVESAEIRERKVRGFADRDRFESGTSIDSVDFDEDDRGSSSSSDGCMVERFGCNMDQPSTMENGKDFNVLTSGDNTAEALPEVSMSTEGHELLAEPSSPTAASRILANLHRKSDSESDDRSHRISGGNEEHNRPQCEDEHCDEAFCADCITRLHHIQSSIMITAQNRAKFIADGDMYECVARLAQENVHEVLAQEGDLEWVTVCNDQTRGAEVRALVDRDHVFPDGTIVVGASRKREGEKADSMANLLEEENGKDSLDEKMNGGEDQPKAAQRQTRPTLLIVTGKGKVRAGVFSRQHLILSGMEPSTALPMVREARKRSMSIVLLDPNARGDKRGMDTFERSMEVLFGNGRAQGDMDVDFPSATNEAKSNDLHHGYSQQEHHHNPMYILSYSASGGQLVRYLMNTANPFLERIRAIAFTDSTHNIQWARNDPRVSLLLESPSCVYVRSADTRRDGTDAHEYRAGEEVETDHHWRRRFGAVRTLSAGMAEHALANWACHSHIWEHFDRHFHLCGQSNQHHRCAGGSDGFASISESGSRSRPHFRSRDFGAITI